MKYYSQLNSSIVGIDRSLNGSDLFFDWIEMQSEKPEGLWHAKEDGKWHAGNEENESAVINSEMQLITEQLLMHEDNDNAAIATVQEWRDYRKALRRWNWQQNDCFPDPTHRPRRPV